MIVSCLFYIWSVFEFIYFQIHSMILYTYADLYIMKYAEDKWDCNY